MCCCLHSYFLNDFFHCVIFLILFIYYNFLNYIFLFNNIKIFLNKHITDMGISSDENDWKNAAFARYYGIKGIRIVKNKVNLDTQKTN